MTSSNKRELKIEAIDLPDLNLVEISDKALIDAKPRKHLAIDEIHKLILENVRLLKEEDNAATA